MSNIFTVIPIKPPILKELQVPPQNSDCLAWSSLDISSTVNLPMLKVLRIEAKMRNGNASSATQRGKFWWKL